MQAILPHIPRGTALLVDVSNISPEQWRRLPVHVPVVLVSTHKSFNFLHGTGATPAVPKGTTWIVLRIPHRRDHSRDVHTTHFRRQRFRPEVSRRKNSPALHYLKNAKRECVIDGTTTTPPPRASHALCEMDDKLLLALSSKTGLPVATNDVRLGRAVCTDRKVHTAAAMRELVDFTPFSVLQKRGDGTWIEKATGHCTSSTKSRR